MLTKLKSAFDPYLLLTLVLCVFAIAPLTYPGYFQTHSGFLPLWNLSDLRQNLLDPGWLPGLTPFDTWRSGGLLPYYLAALLIPLSPLNALKLVSAGGILLGASGLYLWLKSWLGSAGATVSALAYVYAPFSLATLYVRGAWAEAFFWGLLPWALLAATYLVAVPKPPIIVIATGFWFALGLSHLGLSLPALLFLAAMQLIFHRPQAKFPLLAASSGLILALAFLGWRAGFTPNSLPLSHPLTHHLLYPAQLILPTWGFGLSVPGWNDGLSLSLGVALLGLMLVSVAVWRGGPDRRPWLFLGTAGVACLLMLPGVGAIWGLPGFSAWMRYPWQLLGLASLSLSVVAGVSFWLDERLRHLPLFGSTLIIILLSVYPYLEPQFITTSLPAEPVALYGPTETPYFALLDYQFVQDNPVEGTDLNPVDPYIPLGDDPPSPGETFYLQVEWQGLNRSHGNYKIFGHLVDEAGQIITQVDVLPQAGERPTPTWLPGEIILDQYTFNLPATAPPPHQVWLGFYDDETLIRLNVPGDNEGRAKLDVR